MSNAPQNPFGRPIQNGGSYQPQGGAYQQGSHQPYGAPYQPVHQPPARSSNTLVVVLLIVGGVMLSFLLLCGVLGFFLMMPAVQQARNVARNVASANNMKQISIGLLSFHDTHGQFPYTEQQLGPDGTPLLSWRVHVLPYLGEDALYQQFHLDEPWDSPHNRTLIPMMPSVYQAPDISLGPGMTTYRAASGQWGAIPVNRTGFRLNTFTDGSSNTVMTVAADQLHAIEWTNPAAFDNQLSSLHRDAKGNVLVGMADGSVQSFEASSLQKSWDSAIHIQDGKGLMTYSER